MIGGSFETRWKQWDVSKLRPYRTYIPHPCLLTRNIEEEEVFFQSTSLDCAVMHWVDPLTLVQAWWIDGGQSSGKVVQVDSCSMSRQWQAVLPSRLAGRVFCLRKQSLGLGPCGLQAKVHLGRYSAGRPRCLWWGCMVLQRKEVQSAPWMQSGSSTLDHPLWLLLAESGRSSGTSFWAYSAAHLTDILEVHPVWQHYEPALDLKILASSVRQSRRFYSGQHACLAVRHLCWKPKISFWAKTSD